MEVAFRTAAEQCIASCARAIAFQLLLEEIWLFPPPPPVAPPMPEVAAPVAAPATIQETVGEAHTDLAHTQATIDAHDLQVAIANMVAATAAAAVAAADLRAVLEVSDGSSEGS